MENRDTLGRVVTCSFKYSVLTRSGRCLKNPHINQIIPFITFRDALILDIWLSWLFVWEFWEKKYTDHYVCVNMLRQIKCFVLNTIRFSQSDCLADFVVGNIDMVTMEKKSTFPTHQVKTYTCIKVYKVTF